MVTKEMVRIMTHVKKKMEDVIVVVQWGEYLEFLDLLLELCDKVLFVFQSGVEAADLHVFPEE